MSTTNASDDEMDWEEVIPDVPNAGDVVVTVSFDAPATGPSTTPNGKPKGSGRKLDDA